ncbi:MAG: tryptophan synthase subunit beta [bacterium]
MTIKYHEDRHFGEYGGQYVPETIMGAVEELEKAHKNYFKQDEFQEEFRRILREYAGRPTPLTYVEKFSEEIGTEVYLKREDLLHTGAHKLNNTIGQILLADRMDKERIIAETGAGQHGVATATVCAYFDKECVVYMGEEDIKRQALNVYRMELLGAEVREVTSGGGTLKDATNAAIRDWVSNVDNTHYLIGSVVGPYPYPAIVRDFQSIIGQEVRRQFKEKSGSACPDGLIACIGGGSNAMGLFTDFIKDEAVDFFGVEAAGEGLDTDRHSASLLNGHPGVLHGSKSYLMSDEDGQVIIPHSISAGLDYPGVGPQLADLKDSSRLQVAGAPDDLALEGFKRLSELEGIIPALEPAHVVGYLLENPEFLDGKNEVVMNLSGRGDKDMHSVAHHEGREIDSV